MTVSLLGMHSWSGARKETGHRTWKANWLCLSDDVNDGPSSVMACSGLPAIGAQWIYGNDNDPWAFCWPDWSIDAYVSDDTLFWMVGQNFTTEPIYRCQTSTITDPLAEPLTLSGDFNTYTYNATQNYLGQPITSSSLEVIRGPETERDGSRPTVEVGQNLSSLPLTSFASMMHLLNDSTLWGVAPRCVKFSRCHWERKLYGVCTFYYTVQYGFDIRYDGFDVVAMDEGTRVLAPGGTATNPKHFQAYKDNTGENARVILDGRGRAWNGTGSPGTVNIQKYGQGNLLLLGIPTSL